MFILAVVFLSACGETQANNSSQNTNQEDPVIEADSSSLSGPDVYAGLCIACHGPDAKGVPNLGKDLTTSEFVATKTDEELVAFIIEGRPGTHPDNTTDVDMPPRGGNPNLTEEEINAVVDYLRTLAE